MGIDLPSIEGIIYGYGTKAKCGKMKIIRSKKISIPVVQKTGEKERNL
ncbi:hypothetical protein BRYFOR_05328 [Marvinbryantia formatexigens DSM 14469]|uniref:Uncharacterized protein n=1 Tax=Marvinbryantia formatexigens DSM 14469 TaxID=478749 RepID=C6L9N8_9FIRM|nr:hypothetical protein BRYFOR_05328 [Marvinbryantia formatexigens DSM 14469]